MKEGGVLIGKLLSSSSAAASSSAGTSTASCSSSLALLLGLLLERGGLRVRGCLCVCIIRMIDVCGPLPARKWLAW